jgi:hypothetical protein
VKLFKLSLLWTLIISGLMPQIVVNAEDSSKPKTYKYLYPINSGEGGWGVLDVNSKWAIPPDKKIGLMYHFNEGLTFYGEEDELGGTMMGIIDENGNKLTEPRYMAGYSFHDGLAIVLYPSGERYFVDRNGKEVYGPFLQNNAKDFNEGLAAVYVESKRKWGYIDTSGKIVIQPIYDAVDSFSEGLACAKVKGKWGYIDKTGKFVITPRFKMIAHPFSEGFASFQEGTPKDLDNVKFGVIDKTGKVVVKPTFEFIEEFHNGIVLAKNSKGVLGFINKQGKYVITLKQKFAFGGFNSGLLAVGVPHELEWKYGFVNSKGEMVLKPQFDEVVPFDNNGIAMVRIGKKVGYIRTDGSYLWKPTPTFYLVY